VDQAKALLSIWQVNAREGRADIRRNGKHWYNEPVSAGTRWELIEIEPEEKSREDQPEPEAERSIPERYLKFRGEMKPVPID
jgi:hypothetical protein